MPLLDYEHQSVLSTPADISHDLRHAAWRLETELGGSSGSDLGGKPNGEQCPFFDCWEKC